MLIRIRNEKRIIEACKFLDYHIGQGVHQPAHHVGQNPKEHAIYGAYTGSYSLVGAGTAYLLHDELGSMDSYFLDILGETYPNVGYMESVAVDPEFRGKGIGSHLIRTRIKFLQSIGVKHIVALCWEHSGPDPQHSLPIYKKLGFDDVEHFSEPWRGTHCPQCGDDCVCDGVLVYRRIDGEV